MKKYLLVSFLVFLSLGAFAQTETEKYMKESGTLSTLFRGRMPVHYPYLYNGTYYWKTKQFEKGSVLYNGKLYEDVYVNVDAARQELQVKYTEKGFPVVLYEQYVAWFTMGNTSFVSLNSLGYKDAPAGYYEVVRDGERPLLVQIKKVMLSRSGNHNGDEIGYMDPHYNMDLNNYFSRQSNYYTLEGNHVVKLRSSAFKKAARSGVPSTPFLEEKAKVWKGDSSEADLLVDQVKVEGIGLPEGYFSPVKQQQEEGPVTDITASYRNKIYVIGNGDAKTVTLSGRVTELETGEPLPGVVVFDDNTSTYARTNAKGYYSITLPGGENIINYSTDSKEEIALRVDLRGNGTLNIELPDKVELLKASVVSAQSMASHRTTSMGVETVSIRTMNKIPSAFGEGDILKAVLTLPGVKTVGEASGGFNVRGGSQDQNLILFNGNTIYNPSHLFGIFSAFNPDVVEDVQLYKSSIPAQYGGRISSVLTVKTKEGSQERFQGSVGIGLLTSRLHLESPIGKKTSFIVGARTTYSDWILGLLPKDSYYSGGKAGFTDANLGVTHRFNPENSLHVSGYFATDRFSFSGDTTFRYTNINASAEFRHKVSDGTSYELNAGYDQYNNKTGIHDWEEGAFDLETYIRQAFFRSHFMTPLGNHQLNYGLDVVGYALDPGIMKPYGDMSTIQASSLQREMAVEPALHVADNWQISDQFSVEAGVRLSSFLFLKPSKFYLGPEWRASVRYSPLPNLSFKAGFNTMRQYIHLISNTSSVSPMDTWKLSDPDIKPTTGWQAAAGVYWTHLGTGIDFSLEGYWKQMENCLDYKPGATLSMNPHLADDLLPVYGRAYGVEAMIKKTTGSLTGWISYSYSRSQYREMQDRGYETLAGGKWYNAPYDKPHEFKLVANWAITHRYSISANIDYSTGRPVTVPVGKYYLGGVYQLAYTERNAHRIPDYFRMDLAFNIDPGHKKKQIIHPTFTIGVYNVTGRKNPYSVFYKANVQGDVKGYMLSVFATQIPYININLLF